MIPDKKNAPGLQFGQMQAKNAAVKPVSIPDKAQPVACKQREIGSCCNCLRLGKSSPRGIPDWPLPGYWQARLN